MSHSMKYPNQSKQNLDSFKNLNRQENTYEQQLTARQSPAPCPVKDDQYEMMRSSPVQRGNTDINHIPPKSSHEYYENKSKTGSSEAEEDESKNVTKSTKSLNSTKKKPDHKYSGLRPNPHTQYGETGVALLRNSKLSNGVKELSTRPIAKLARIWASNYSRRTADSLSLLSYSITNIWLPQVDMKGP
ncbi:unnamed protein product [Trichobilharzia regenti]|nr:unnamed protein product [Trichobilharzia regenti]